MARRLRFSEIPEISTCPTTQLTIDRRIDRSAVTSRRGVISRTMANTATSRTFSMKAHVTRTRPSDFITYRDRPPASACNRTAVASISIIRPGTAKAVTPTAVDAGGCPWMNSALIRPRSGNRAMSVR